MFDFNSITGVLSGGLINPQTPNYAGSAKAAEAQRQALINSGLANINAVFGGGTTPFYSPYSTPLTSQQWKAGGLGPFFTIGKQGTFLPYQLPGQKKSKGGINMGTSLSDITFKGGPIGTIGADLAGAQFGAVSPIDLLGSGGLFGLFGGGGPSPREQVNKLIKQGKLYTAQDLTFQGFTPDFYNQVQKDYVNFAMPQFADQYQQTRDAIKFGLQNRGLQGGSAWDQALSNLAIQTGRGEQQISDTARSYAQQIQQGVEQSRQQAINQLYQSADPAQALQGAISSAAQFRVPQAFTPLVNTFSNIANQYAMNQLYNNNLPSQYINPYSFGGLDLGWMGKTVQ